MTGQRLHRARIKGETGAAIWNELMPNSAAESTEFHTGLLGISSPKVPGPIDYTMLNVGGEDLAEVMQITDDMGPVPPHRVVYFGVDDVDDTAAKVESPGGSVEVPLADILGIDRFAGLKDPQGAMFFIFKSAS
ncbi:MAG: VOC family protein [SAR202 cluster bacterium]|nr:VOC family protein [SAR202 cluster bacterium]MQG71199.1 VOC family protein [SAR202 cluster bacterium]